MRSRAKTFDVLLGHRLRTARRNRGFSQQRVGEYLGITFQQVQKYETGASRLTVEYLVRLCLLYRLPLTALLPTESLLPATLVGSRDGRVRSRVVREIHDGRAAADRPNASSGSNDDPGPDTGREPPEALSKELRALERVLADLQYAATVAEPLDRSEATPCVERLDRIREQVADLACFIESRLKSSR